MPRSDRLLRLLHAIRTTPAPVTAGRLAVETGVSCRSLYRDIDALRSAGAKIDVERGYGYRLVEDPALPPQMLDATEIEVLALGLAEVRAWGDPSLSKAADSVLAKVAAVLPDEQERQLLHAIGHVFRPEPRYPTAIDLTALRTACWAEQAVSISYQVVEGEATERTILPLVLVYNETCVTVLAWCSLRDDFRMFRTDRMADIRPTGDSFRPRRVLLLREYVERLTNERTRRAAL
jgi:predicted DNA-binding transcriptional regulator YafY